MKYAYVIVLNLWFMLACQQENGHVSQAHQDQGSHEMQEGELHLNDLQIQLGNISWDTIKRHSLSSGILISGTVTFDQKKIVSQSSRVMGRIEKLYYKNTGETVLAGSPLYEIYSEEIGMAVSELLLAREKAQLLPGGNADLLESAKNKLLLYGLTDAQVSEIEKAGVVPYTVKILSRVDGIVSQLHSSEGEYVMKGAPVLQVADLSTIWVEGQVYSSEQELVKEGMPATIEVPGLSKNYAGNVVFVNPELNRQSRLNLIRIEIANQARDLKPGMQAYIRLSTGSRDALAVPTDAVIQEEGGASVWVLTRKNMFISKMVQTGVESDGHTEIRSGLRKGDIIVKTGAYLLNSEYIFQKGMNPMAGHDMDPM